ncbi:MAG: peptidyl-prolyl cis-trans isomerase [Oscillospiraceae bacterium]|nr:peptidyl-prolyl cis-trans isomerase [Oscillospiraceae bacterium]
MKTVSRILAALLVLMLIFAAGCANQNAPAPSSVPGTEPSGTSEPSATPGETSDPSADPALSDDPAWIEASALGLSPDDVASNINGKPVTVREFLYWANSTWNNWGLDTGSWDMNIGGTTAGELLADNVIYSIKLYRTVENKCAELGISLSEQDEAELASARDNLIAQYGSEEAYRQALAQSFLSEDLYDYMLRTSYLYSALYDEVCGVNGSKCSDDEALSYGNANGFLRAKHILLSRTDDEGNELSAEEYQKRYEKLEELIAILDKSDDPVAKFDELMHEYSEDPGVANYPDGYQWIEGAMVPSFEEAAKSLDDYGYSGVVEMAEYGYTVVMRLPLDPEAVAINDELGYTLRMNASMSHFDDILSEWSEELSVEFLPAYDSLDYKTAFESVAADK